MVATMARPAAQGNRRAGLFPRLLQGVMRESKFRSGATPNQVFNSNLIFLSNSSNGLSPAIIPPLMKKRRSLDLQRLAGVPSVGCEPVEQRLIGKTGFSSSAAI
jgi:hypothetical protein